MKIAVIIVRTLLGLAFILFGANAFLNFIKPPPDLQLPQLAMDFNNALMNSPYLKGVGAFELAGGLLLLTGRFTPLGLALLAPVLVNIVFFHAFLSPIGWQPGAVCVAMELFLLCYYRSAFAGLLRPWSGSQLT